MFVQRATRAASLEQQSAVSKRTRRRRKNNNCLPRQLLILQDTRPWAATSRCAVQPPYSALNHRLMIEHVYGDKDQGQFIERVEIDNRDSDVPFILNAAWAG